MLVGQAGQTRKHGFGRWTFDADTGDLYDGEGTTRLEPRVARLLEHFLAHQHEVISRDELIVAVWENRVVSDDAINRGVSILRQVLSPDDKNAYIETVVRRGYIAHFPPAPVSERGAARTVPRRSYLLLVALACVAALILYTALGDSPKETRQARESRLGGPPMVAVLPFSAASEPVDSQFFANGVYEDLLTQLTKLQSLRVISGTSMKQYRSVSRNMRRIGDETGADAILEGSVQIVADRIHINAQLIDTRTDEHLWAERYDRRLTAANLFDVQGEIARAIAVEMNATLTTEDRRQLTLIPTRNMAAYRAYHRAMQLRDDPRGSVTDPEYREALEEAVRLDPAFSRAWAELVTNLSFLNFSGDRPDMTLRAEQALEHLQAVAPGSADLLIGQAAYVYYELKDYNRAHDLVSKALAMAPSDVNAVQLRSWIERRQGDFNAFVKSKYEARQLDPRNPILNNELLNGLLFAHSYDIAFSEAKNAAVETFTTGYTGALGNFREQRDFKQLQGSTKKLCETFERPDCGWEVYIANRDYPGAMQSLGQPGESAYPTSGDNDYRRLLTFWMMQEPALEQQGLPLWLSTLEERYAAVDTPPPFHSHIGRAMLAGLQGKADESLQLIELWLGQKPVDWAERISLRHYACRTLGMSAATEAAVRCIRDGLKEASYIVPFLEPYFPYYDSIRAEPEFIEMLAEIDGAAPSPE